MKMSKWISYCEQIIFNIFDQTPSGDVFTKLCYLCNVLQSKNLSVGFTVLECRNTPNSSIALLTFIKNVNVYYTLYKKFFL